MIAYREAENAFGQQPNKGGSTGCKGAFKASVEGIDQVAQVGRHYLGKHRVVAGGCCPYFEHPHGNKDAAIYDYSHRLTILW